ncbi:hypothetical protein LCGC14_1774110 [marine sediment metagenome]|uniref:Uncharacterized protein n=1 Tax=marine sediment metagenome TaxID=412755 RepID=A0A0F9HJW4_9ZZZZ
MFYRTRIDLAFTTQADALKAREKALAMLPEAVTINPNTPQEERGFITVERCFHDEDPSLDCLVIEHHQTT